MSRKWDSSVRMVGVPPNGVILVVHLERTSFCSLVKPFFKGGSILSTFHYRDTGRERTMYIGWSRRNTIAHNFVSENYFYSMRRLVTTFRKMYLGSFISLSFQEWPFWALPLSYKSSHACGGGHASLAPFKCPPQTNQKTSKPMVTLRRLADNRLVGEPFAEWSFKVSNLGSGSKCSPSTKMSTDLNSGRWDQYLGTERQFQLRNWATL